MFEIVLNIVGFFAGVHLTMMLIASLYRLIDLNYCIKEFWLEITARIGLNAGLIFLVYFLTNGSFESGFLLGQVFFTIFHVSIFWLGQLTLFLNHRD
tara:strand:- start:149 stop:439 length:291 start_codon:yes stop_codon:yes gene_type:complete